MEMIKKIGGLAIIVLLIFGSTACDDEDDQSLQLIRTNSYHENLQAVENHSLGLSVFTEECLLKIVGGSGVYSVGCSGDTLLQVVLEDNILRLKPLKTGDPVVTVRDESGNGYVLNVHISYPVQQFRVVKLETRVEGKDITVGEKELIEKQVMESFPVETGGGYRLIYTEKEMRKGKVQVFSRQFNGTVSEEGTFEMKRVPGDEFSYLIVTMKFEGRQVEYIFMPYQGSRTKSTDHLVPMAFVEDVTLQYKTGYPAVEAVYAFQLVQFLAVSD